MIARGPGRWLYGALALSVAVNLAGAGFLLGAEAPAKKPRRTVEDTIAFVSARYPDSMGAAVRAKLEARRDDVARALEEMYAARRAGRAAMGVEPIDRAGVEAAFRASREKAAAFQTVIHGAITDALPDATPADRARVARGERD